MLKHDEGINPCSSCSYYNIEYKSGLRCSVKRQKFIKNADHGEIENCWCPKGCVEINVED